LTSTDYTYDNEGQRTTATPTTGPATSYGYDQAGNLSSVTRAASGSDPAIAETYTYDGDGLRQASSDGTTTTQLAGRTSSGLPLLMNDGGADLIYGPEDDPLAQITGDGTVTYYHHDQLGSTRLVTGSSGSSIASYTYDPYGRTLAHTGSDATMLLWDGQYKDSVSGTYYLPARSYDPETGQFVSRDPLSGLTREPYVYGANTRHGQPGPGHPLTRECSS
jgi:RHS repeat-associated protein